jgi:hypothetical protein
VDLKSAQIASCIQTSVFKKALETVESVLETGLPSMTRTTKEASSSKSPAQHVYATLLQAHKFRRHVDVLLANLIEAENALIASGEFRGNDLKELDNGALFRCVVFGWTCSIFKV